MEKRQILVGRRSRRGLTLIEAALSLMVAAVVMVGLAQLISGAADTTRARVTADRLEQVSAAAQAYIQTNFAQLYVDADAAPVRVLAAGDANALREKGFLPSTYVDQNPYGQQHAVIIRTVKPNPPDPTIQPRLEAIVTTYGGSAIPDRQLGQIATFVGADAGFMLAAPVPSTENRVTGVSGGWNALASQWVAGGTGPSVGRVMTSMAFNEGVLVGDYLNRRNIGIPEANTMRTNLNMAGSDINDVPMLTNAGNTVSLRIDTATLTPEVGIDTNLDVGTTLDDGTVIGGDITASRMIDRNNTAYSVDPNAISNINALNVAQISGNTQVASGAVGTPLLSGTLADRLPNYVAKGGFLVRNLAQIVPKPTCGVGGSPKITYAMIQDGSRFASNVSYGSGYVNVQGSNVANLYNGNIDVARRYHVTEIGPDHWQVDIQGTPPSVPWSGLAMVYCYYP